jgi:hypothetical protein
VASRAGLGRSAAGSAGGWGIDPTLHGLQTREQKHLCKGDHAPSDLTYKPARHASDFTALLGGRKVTPLAYSKLEHILKWTKIKVNLSVVN